MKIYLALFALLVIAQFVFSAAAMESQKALPANSNNCDMCKYIVGEVEQYMNSSEKVIEEKLVEACKLLPGGLEQMCDTIVVLYGHQIIEWVLTKETPPVICKQIGLCPKKQSQPIVPIVVPELKEEEQANDGKCDLCVYVVGMIEDYVKGNATEEKIKKALEKVCDKLGPISGLCKQFVKQYEHQLIEFLTQKLPPKEVCKKLHLCPQTKIVVAPTKPKELKQDGCALCKFIVGTVENYLKDNATVEIIEEKVKKFCEFIPGQLGEDCKKYAEEFIPQIIEYIEKSYTPEQACQMIGACPKAMLRKVKSDNCNSCKFFLGLILQYVESNETIEYVEEQLAQLCQYLPAPYGDQCTALEKEYLPMVIHYLAEKYTAEEICQMVGFCPTARFNPHKRPHHGSPVSIKIRQN